VRVKCSSLRVEAGGLGVLSPDFRAQEVVRAGSRVAVACDGQGPAEGIREIRRRRHRAGISAEGWALPDVVLLVGRDRRGE